MTALTPVLLAYMPACLGDTGGAARQAQRPAAAEEGTELPRGARGFLGFLIPHALEGWAFRLALPPPEPRPGTTWVWPTVGGGTLLALPAPPPQTRVLLHLPTATTSQVPRRRPPAPASSDAQVPPVGDPVGSPASSPGSSSASRASPQGQHASGGLNPGASNDQASDPAAPTSHTASPSGRTLDSLGFASASPGSEDPPPRSFAPSLPVNQGRVVPELSPQRHLAQALSLQANMAWVDSTMRAQGGAENPPSRSSGMVSVSTAAPSSQQTLAAGRASVSHETGVPVSESFLSRGQGEGGSLPSSEGQAHVQAAAPTNPRLRPTDASPLPGDGVPRGDGPAFMPHGGALAHLAAFHSHNPAPSSEFTAASASVLISNSQQALPERNMPFTTSLPETSGQHRQQVRGDGRGEPAALPSADLSLLDAELADAVRFAEALAGLVQNVLTGSGSSATPAAPPTHSSAPAHPSSRDQAATSDAARSLGGPATSFPMAPERAAPLRQGNTPMPPSRAPREIPNPEAREVLPPLGPQMGRVSVERAPSGPVSWQDQLFWAQDAEIGVAAPWGDAAAVYSPGSPSFPSEPLNSVRYPSGSAAFARTDFQLVPIQTTAWQTIDPLWRPQLVSGSHVAHHVQAGTEGPSRPWSRHRPFEMDAAPRDSRRAFEDRRRAGWDDILSVTQASVQPADAGVQPPVPSVDIDAPPVVPPEDPALDATAIVARAVMARRSRISVIRALLLSMLPLGVATVVEIGIPVCLRLLSISPSSESPASLSAGPSSWDVFLLGP